MSGRQGWVINDLKRIIKVPAKGDIAGYEKPVTVQMASMSYYKYVVFTPEVDKRPRTIETFSQLEAALLSRAQVYRIERDPWDWAKWDYLLGNFEECDIMADPKGKDLERVEYWYNLLQDHHGEPYVNFWPDIKARKIAAREREERIRAVSEAEAQKTATTGVDIPQDMLTHASIHDPVDIPKTNALGQVVSVASVEDFEREQLSQAVNELYSELIVGQEPPAAPAPFTFTTIANTTIEHHLSAGERDSWDAKYGGCTFKVGDWVRIPLFIGQLTNELGQVVDKLYCNNAVRSWIDLIVRVQGDTYRLGQDKVETPVITELYTELRPWLMYNDGALGEDVRRENQKTASQLMASGEWAHVWYSSRLGSHDYMKGLWETGLRAFKTDDAFFAATKEAYKSGVCYIGAFHGPEPKEVK